MPITWKNIEIGDNRAANSLLVSSSNTLTDSLDKLGDLASKQGETQAKNWDIKAGQNTADALAKVQGINDIKVLEESMKSGLNIDTLDQQYGKQYDKSLIAKTLEAKQKELQTKGIADADRLRNIARQDEQDRLAREKAERDKLESAAAIREREAALKANLLRGQEASLRLSMAKHDNDLSLMNERFKTQLSTFQVEALEGSKSPEEAITKFKDKAYEFVRESQGMFSAADADTLIGSFSTVAKKRGLDQAHYVKENVMQANGYKNALETLTKEHDVIRTKIQKHYGYDPSVAKLQEDPMTDADAQIEVSNLIAGKDKGKYDENQIAAAFTGIRVEFRNRGIEPSPAVIRDVIISSGWEQEWFNMGDAMPDQNKSVIGTYADKIRRNNDYLTGAASLNVNQMEQTMKGQISKLNATKNAFDSELASDAFRDANDKNARFSDIGEYVDTTEIKRPDWGDLKDSSVATLKAEFKRMTNAPKSDEEIEDEKQRKAAEEKLKPKTQPNNPRGVKPTKQ